MRGTDAELDYSLKDELLASLTELDRLGYVGGPDSWVKRQGTQFAITVDRTPKGWVAKLHLVGYRMNEEGYPAQDNEGRYVEEWLLRDARYFKTMCGVVAQARNYTGLVQR